MKERLDIEHCKHDFLRQVEPDEDKIASLLELSQHRLELIALIPRTEQMAALLAESYYEAIKELLVAFLLKNGLKSSKHECMTIYFRHACPDLDFEASIILELKDIRNKVAYEGAKVKKTYIEMNEREFNHVIQTLKKLILSGT